MGGLFSRIIGRRADCQLEAVADLSADSLASLQSDLPATAAYQDFRDMLAKHEFDAVVVATTDDAHLDPCLAALEAGAHLFVEKPLAHTAETAEAIVTAAADAEKVLAVGHTLRFDASYAFARERVQSGAIGRLIQVYARRNASLADGWPGDRRPVTDPKFPLKPPSLAHYLTVHDIDAVHWVTGVKHSLLKGASMPAGFSPGLGVLALLEAADGSAAMFESSYARTPGVSARTATMLEVIGTDGMVELIGGKAIHYSAQGEAANEVNTDGSMSETGIYATEIDDFIRAITTDGSPLCAGEDAAYAVRTADAILHAAGIA
jgi:myo-inositol 2-dehydrogenase/D-chiro-inositol 1-dehydrogenase